jgi:DNA-binding NarL/FixJ family response regulator
MRIETVCASLRSMRTVLIVDDHEGFRAEARRLLEREGFTVIGEANDGASAIKSVAALAPELVLLDVQLPDRTGFEVCEAIPRPPGGPTVVLVSSREAADYGAKVARSGAAGFISKGDLSGAGIAALIEGRHERG